MLPFTKLKSQINQLQKYSLGKSNEKTGAYVSSLQTVEDKKKNIWNVTR